MLFTWLFRLVFRKLLFCGANFSSLYKSSCGAPKRRRCQLLLEEGQQRCRQSRTQEAGSYFVSVKLIRRH